MKFNLGPLENKKNLLTGLTVVAPIIGGGLLLENAYSKNPDAFKKIFLVYTQRSRPILEIRLKAVPR